MAQVNGTPFSSVYNLFFAKITDDFYMEMTELDTYRILQDLLIAAVQKFEFPKQNLDYELIYLSDIDTYEGIDSCYKKVPIKIYEGGYFYSNLTHEEQNIISVYMVVEWFGQQLASVEQTRMKYSGTDFKFTSQASHMNKILLLKSDYEREGFHLQRLYKRRFIDKNGHTRSTFGIIMKPFKKYDVSKS